MKYFTKLFFWLMLFIPISSFSQHVKILVVAIHGVETAQHEWQPMIHYLQQALPQHTFKLVPKAPIDLHHIKELINKKEIDFIVTQPAIYVELEMNFGISRILTMVKDGGFSKFGSTIITRADSKIRSIDDLKGKKIAGVAKLGFGGWLIGYKELLDNEFYPFVDAEKVVFLGTQPKEIDAVINGKVDAAIIRTGVLEKLSAEGKININDFHILAPKIYPDFPFKVSTSLYPEWAFAKTQKVSNQLSKSVALALLSLTGTSDAAKKARFQEWTFPYDYQPVHELLKALKVGSYKDYGRISMMEFLKQHKIEAGIVLIFGLIILFMTTVVYRSNINLSKEKAEKENILEKMKYLATHDHLTELPNRFLFVELLEKMIHGAIRRKTDVAVMFIDLDGFKKINDLYGHDAGDKILCRVAKTLLGSLRLNDIAGRFGGDEFIVAINEVKEIDDIRTLADRIIEQISTIELTEAPDFDLGASIGVVYGKIQQNNAQDLIRLCDKLMYEAKQSGKGRAILKEISALNPETILNFSTSKL